MSKVTIFVLAFSTASCMSQMKADTCAEPLHLSAEDTPTNKKLNIPAEAWDVLVNDADVKSALSTTSEHLETPPRKWFAAYNLNLSGGHRANDWIIEASDQLVGANVNLF